MSRARGTVAHINLSNIRHNLNQFRRMHAGSVIAVVKANAYGHNLKMIVPALVNADAFAVATIEEALQVRRLNADKAIILLEGVFNAKELQLAVEHNFDLVVHQQYQIELLAKSTGLNLSKAWLKIDTGMNRLGFEVGECVEKIAQLKKINGIGEVCLMTHFAQSDCPDATQTRQQTKHNNWIKTLGLSYSLSNTAAVLNGMSDNNEWARIGIGMFGISPLPGTSAADYSLKPVMDLKAKIIAIKTILAGKQVGYGAHYTSQKETTMAIVGIGYADGYPWHKYKSSQASIGGIKVPIIGRVSMDMLALDISELPGIEVGEEVLLWGGDLPVEIVSNDLDLIPYTLTCGITNRVKYYGIQ
ncbi:MAG: alanine racemase [Proteobacteria bacterium]|nr:alanine racemase [Pseudomonadota bacterium]